MTAIDRKEVREYIAQDNPVAALVFDELFAEKAGQLFDHPGLGRPGRVVGTRELVVHPNYSWQRGAGAAYSLHGPPVAIAP